MKVNKKVLIPLFATAMSLSAIGGISGAIAWYQYNSKVTSSYVGASVADTGVLQIGTYQKVFDENGDPVYVDPQAQNPVQKEVLVWGRDLVKPNADRLVPVTFGAMQEVQDPVLDEHGDPVDADQDGHDDYTTRYLLPSKAYAYPEAGCGEGYVGHQHVDDFGKECNVPGWTEAKKGEDYSQIEFYMRAVQTDSNEDSGFRQVERDVFISDYILRSVVGDSKFAHEALRVHIAINDGADGGILLANKEYKDNNDPYVDPQNYDEGQDERLKLYGPLNLDISNQIDAVPQTGNVKDKYHGTLFNDFLKSYGNHPADREGYYPESVVPLDGEGHATALANGPYYEGEEVIYGNYGEKQITKSLANVKQERNANLVMPAEGEAGYENKIFTTKANEAVKVTLTIWLEGWEPLPTEGDGSNAKVEWNPKYTADTSVQVGLQFDTGVFRGSDLAQ
jgi:hypothetical protein